MPALSQCSGRGARLYDMHVERKIVWYVCKFFLWRFFFTQKEPPATRRIFQSGRLRAMWFAFRAPVVFSCLGPCSFVVSVLPFFGLCLATTNIISLPSCSHHSAENNKLYRLWMGWTICGAQTLSGQMRVKARSARTREKKSWKTLEKK